MQPDHLRPFVLPHPLSFPGGGGGVGDCHLVNKIFFHGSLCCCMGDCVVGHCHWHPLYSWEDIFPNFAEMELDSTTMFPPRTNVMFIRSTGEPVLAQQVAFYKRHSRREMGSQKSASTCQACY